MEVHFMCYQSWILFGWKLILCVISLKFYLDGRSFCVLAAFVPQIYIVIYSVYTQLYISIVIFINVLQLTVLTTCYSFGYWLNRYNTH